MSQLQSSLVQEKNYLEEIFKILDAKDGIKDGKIDCKFLLKWLDAQSLNSRIEFEYELALNKYNIASIIQSADSNKDGYIDKQEFMELVLKKVATMSKQQQNMYRNYFQVLAYAEEYYFWPPPFFIITITIIQTIFFAMHIVYYGGKTISNCSYFTFIITLRSQCWRFISYMFVHLSYSHILFNMCVQIFVGIPLEMSHGFIRVGFLYLAGVFAGSLTSSLAEPTINLAGASAGVYCLITAHIATITLNWKDDVFILRKRIRNGKIAQPKSLGTIVRILRLLLVVSTILADFGYTIWNCLDEKYKNDYATSWEGHLAGGLTGILLGIVVLKNRRVEKWETWLKLVCVLSYTVAILAMIMGNIFVSNCKDGCYFKEEWSWTKYEEVRSNISQSFHINCTWY